MRHFRYALRRLALLAILAAGMGIATPAAAIAQDTTSTANVQPTPTGSLVILTLRDGSHLQGRILEVTPTHLRFTSVLGESQIARDAVVRYRVASDEYVRDGQVWPEDPSRTRLFFAPTGRTLRAREAYFSDAYIVFPSVQVGLTNTFTMGGGLSLIPGVGLHEQVYYLTPKLGVYASPTLNVSVGALVAAASWASEESPFGLGYGVATFGGEHTNFTVGGGFAYSRGSASTEPLLLLGGVNRVSRSVALVTENYLLAGSDGGALLSGGIRLIGERLSVDLAGFFATGAEYPVPYLAFIYKL